MGAKKMKYILVLFLVLFGCENKKEIQRTEIHKCTSKSDRALLAQFIIDCSEAANPKSDEEGEDLVAQCEATGVRTLCPTIEQCRTITRSGNIFGFDDFGDFGPCQ